jgi:hypothetical protein
MNLNELYFFKTIQCMKKERHDFDTCYFAHHANKDLRRINIDFSGFIKKPEIFNSSELNRPLEKTLLKYYRNEVGFENEILNDLMFPGVSPCKNLYEIKYHIKNYKTKVCFFESNKLKCMYGDLCPDYHTSLEIEKVDLEILNFRKIFEKLSSSNSEYLTNYEVLDIYNKLYKAENRFLFTKNYLMNIEEKLNFSISKNEENLNLRQKNLNKENQTEQHAPTIIEKTPVYKLSQRSNPNILSSTNSIKIHNLIKSNIFKELKNIPVLCKGDLFCTIINTDNQVVYLSNASPKKEDLNKLLIAFMNSHNGVIIYGADINTNKLSGIRMDRKSRDIFRQNFNTEYKDYLVEYERCIKYKFYDLDESNTKKDESFVLNNPFSRNGFTINDPLSQNENFCVIVIKVKKIKNHKLIFDPYNKTYNIKDKYLQKFCKNQDERIKLTDIKCLNMKEYIEITKERLIEYYKEKN